MPLHYANVITFCDDIIMLDKHACMLGICWCMYVCMYALTSIFVHAGIHEYVGMYICMSVCW